MDLRAPLRRAIRCVGGEGNEPTPHRTATNDPSPPLQAGGGHNRVTFPRARFHLGLSQHGRTVAGSTTLWRQSSGSDPMDGSLSDDTGQFPHHLWGNHLFLLVPGRRKRPQFFFAGVSCSEGKTAYMRHSHLILPGRRKCPRKFCGHFRRFWARLATQPSHAASSGTRELPIFWPFSCPHKLPVGSSKFV
jgi:hypothetical protein